MPEQLPEEQIIEQVGGNDSPDKLNMLSRLFERTKSLTIGQRIALTALLAVLVVVPGTYAVLEERTNKDNTYEVLKDKKRFPPSQKVVPPPEMFNENAEPLENSDKLDKKPNTKEEKDSNDDDNDNSPPVERDSERGDYQQIAIA